MEAPLLKALRRALYEARREHESAALGGCMEPEEHLSLCVTHLEDALLRAMVAFQVNGLRLDGRAE